MSLVVPQALLFACFVVAAYGQQDCGGDATDLVLVFDSSGSVNEAEFTQSLQFAQDLVGTLTIGPQGVLVGAVRFSDCGAIETVVPLGSNENVAGVQAQLAAIAHVNGATCTGDAIDHAAGVLHNSTRSANKVMVIFTDGQSGDDPCVPSQNARDSGIAMIAIGIGDIVPTEITCIGLDGELTVGNFDDLQMILGDLGDLLCADEWTMSISYLVVDVEFKAPGHCDLDFQLTLSMDCGVDFEISTTGIMSSLMLQCTQQFDVQMADSDVSAIPLRTASTGTPPSPASDPVPPPPSEPASAGADDAPDQDQDKSVSKASPNAEDLKDVDLLSYMRSDDLALLQDPEAASSSPPPPSPPPPSPHSPSPHSPSPPTPDALLSAIELDIFVTFVVMVTSSNGGTWIADVTTSAWLLCNVTPQLPGGFLMDIECPTRSINFDGSVQVYASQGVILQEIGQASSPSPPSSPSSREPDGIVVTLIETAIVPSSGSASQSVIHSVQGDTNC